MSLITAISGLVNLVFRLRLLTHRFSISRAPSAKRTRLNPLLNASVKTPLIAQFRRSEEERSSLTKKASCDTQVGRKIVLSDPFQTDLGKKERNSKHGYANTREDRRSAINDDLKFPAEGRQVDTESAKETSVVQGGAIC